jgi:hypothetical protein
LANFLSAFGPNFVGLTGSKEDIASAAAGLRVYFRKQPLEGGGYTVDHSTLVYLIDVLGNVVDSLAGRIVCAQAEKTAVWRRTIKPKSKSRPEDQLDRTLIGRSRCASSLIRIFFNDGPCTASPNRAGQATGRRREPGDPYPLRMVIDT